MTEPAILSVDTSGPYCAAALISGDRLLVARKEEMTKGQVERLIPLLEEVLAEANMTWKDLAGIGVGIGPGNFTGIRIAVSAARGLALSLGIPAIGVSSLEALNACTNDGSLTLTLVDARQGKVFAQVFAADGTASDAPILIAPEAITSSFCRGATTVIGHRADDVAEKLGMIAQPATVTDMVTAIARLAFARLDQKTPAPAPLYIRPADAAPPRDPAPKILT